MNSVYNFPLMVGAVLSAIAAALHVGIIIGGASWYRFFGAGERLALAAAAGWRYPALITSGIALVLSAWSAYAFSGAGLLRPLPMLKEMLILITLVYLLRGLTIVPLLTVAKSKTTPFLLWSSLVCLGYGAVHLLGLFQVWEAL